MSSGRLSGLATASKAISGAVCADAGNAPRQAAASKANKKRFMLNLLPMFFVCGFWDWPKPHPMSSPSPDFDPGIDQRSSSRCACVKIANATGLLDSPLGKRGMTRRVIDALSRLCLLHGVRLQDELLHAPGFDLADDDLVRVAAIHHVDHLEAAEFLAGMTELADDGSVQLHLIDLASDRPRAGHISIGIGVGSEEILVRPLGNACGPANTD